MRIPSYDNSNLVPLKNYLLRPKRLDGESLRGYLYRFYDLNQLRVPIKVWNLVDEIYRQETTDSAKLNQLQQLTGDIHVITEKDWLQKHKLPKLKYANQANNIYLASTRCCPHCINEKKGHLAIWDLPLFTACPKHGCLLVYRSSRLIRWRTMKPDWVCIDEVAIQDIKTHQAAKFQLWLSNCILQAKDSQDNYYQNAKPIANFTSDYSIKDIYEAIAWAHFFRIKVNYLSFNYLNDTEIDSLNTVRTFRFGNQECNFLFNLYKNKFARRILARLATNELNLSVLIMKSRLLKLLTTETASLQTNRNSFSEPIITQLESFTRQFSDQLQNEMAAWINSFSSNVVTPKQAPLEQFLQWWSCIRDQRTAAPTIEYSQSRKRIDEVLLKTQIESIIKKLISASLWPDSTVIYQKLLIGFYFPPILIAQFSSEEMLSQLLSYLATINLSLLADLKRRLELAQLIWEDAQIDRNGSSGFGKVSYVSAT